MKTKEIRDLFISYFGKHGHEPVESSRLIPENDPTLLFTNAGMNQFKNTFLGLEERPYSRAVSVQKCVRAGGKHNDLENVGFTARHHTFFEMLGNFSFGDYFKKEAIHFAWDFVTKELQLDKKRLYVSVYKDDDDAAEIWQKQEGVPKDRIYRFGEKDNFWRMGNTGPCGPCSEIFYDLGPEVEGDPKENVVGGEGDRYVEFWNLVFMQFNEDENGQTPLPNPSIDTGSGLERVATILQGVTNNYHTDGFQSIFQQIAQASGQNYLMDTSRLKGTDLSQQDQINVAFRVISDHVRASSFLIADGVMPSNEGRGYVLRRILRRGIRFARELNPDTSQNVIQKAAETVINEMGGFYGELNKQGNLILTTLKDEQTRFLKTLDQGTEILNDALIGLDKKGLKTLPGETAFKLYDTYGFPMDLTRLMAQEKGFQIDEGGFNDHMEKAREKAKASWKGSQISGDQAFQVEAASQVVKKFGETKFIGYGGVVSGQGKSLVLSNGAQFVDKLESGNTGFIVFDQTCFYAESGGQVGDIGQIVTTTGQGEVMDCQKVNGVHLHLIKVTDGFLSEKGEYSLQVTHSKRRDTANNHSATHLMHSALKAVLGDHVTQAGSLVEPDRLRFDFTHNKPVSTDEIQSIENFVNREIALAHPVKTEEMEPQKAIEEGALALFGEKYGDSVRVVKMGDSSMELCGGTHVENTAMIRIFKIVSEGGVSAGVRRIEAITGQLAADYLLKNTRENIQVKDSIGAKDNWQSYLQESSSSVINWVEKKKDEIKDLEKEIKSLKGGQIDVDQMIHGAQEFSKGGKSGKLVLADIQLDDRQVLSELSDKLKNKIQSGVVVIIGNGDKSHPIIVSVSKDLNPEIHAGKLLKEISEAMGGKGGGRPDFAQGAGKDRTKISEAFAKAESLL